MSENILQSVKHDLSGITPEYTHFDPDIIRAINAEFVTLWELGVGDEIKSIDSGDETYEDLFGTDPYINLIKPWLKMRVQLVFDPPTTGTLLEALERKVAEYEARISYIVDPAEDNVLR